MRPFAERSQRYLMVLRWDRLQIGRRNRSTCNCTTANPWEDRFCQTASIGNEMKFSVSSQFLSSSGLYTWLTHVPRDRPVIPEIHNFLSNQKIIIVWSLSVTNFTVKSASFWVVHSHTVEFCRCRNSEAQGGNHSVLCTLLIKDCLWCHVQATVKSSNITGQSMFHIVSYSVW